MGFKNTEKDIHIKLIETLKNASDILLRYKSLEEGIIKVFESLGQTLHIQRIYLFENGYDEFENLTMSQRIEWASNAVTPQIDNKRLVGLPYNQLPELYDALSKNEHFCGIVKKLNGNLKQVLQEQDIQSVLLTPIYTFNRWHGFIGFDDCEEERVWDEASITIIKAIANMIAAAIQRGDVENSLALSQKYFESLFERAPEGIAIVRPDGTIEKVNNEFCKLFSYYENEALGKNIDELILTSDKRHEAKELTIAAARGEKVAVEGIRYTKESVPAYVSIIGVPIDFQGEHKGIYVIYRDISERKLAEKNLQESQTKFKTLFDSSNDAIFLMKDDIFIDCNKSASRIYDTTEEELIGESPVKFTPLYQSNGRTSESIVREKIDAAKNGESETFDFTHVTGKGKVFDAEINLNKVVLKDSDFIQAIVRDITERKKAEKELVEAKVKAEESDRLKTAFLASMSHEIRTPMNHILGGLDLLLDPDITNDEKEEFHGIIKNSSNQLLNLIDDIIDVSQLDAGQIEIKKENFELKLFLEELVEDIDKYTFEKGHLDFQINTSAHQKSIDNVYADQVRLKQVLFSLISNAYKFTENGSVEVGYERISENMLQFYVSDTGIGIPEDSEKIIFEQFRQIDYEHTREYEGAGLGLTIAKGMVELMGGNIWVESELGKGSTFYFSVNIKPPKLKKPQMQSRPADTVGSAIDWSDKTILIVEDEEMNYQYLKTVLRKTHANVLWAENGLIGVNMAKKNEVHLILMDIQMPEMNGYESTRQILDNKPKIPIIAQTAHALKEEKSKCFEVGAIDYMSKPLNRKKLLELISKHIL